MMDILTDIAWTIWWAATIGFSTTTARLIIHDTRLGIAEQAEFLFTPIGWAVIIVFWFN